MFGIGFLEICIIILVALILVGPKKLPELMMNAGKMFVQLRRMSNEVKSTFDHIIDEAEQDLDKNETKYKVKTFPKRDKMSYVNINTETLTQNKASFVEKDNEI